MLKKVATVLALSFGATVLVSATPAAEVEPVRQFPTIQINTTPELWEDRETWFAGDITIIDPRNEEWSLELTEADIRGRGNSTWRHGEGKRPLRFRFAEPTAILQYEHEARTWITLANHFDPSLLRNHLVMELARNLDGLGWTPVSQFVHMYVNDEYKGVYQITDERDLNDYRMDITVDEDPTISEFVLERDRRAQASRSPGNVRGLHYVQAYGVTYDIRFPSGSLRTEAHGEYVNNFMHEVSRSIRSGDWDRITDIVDIPSMVDFYIIQELSRNPDSGFSSLFMSIRNTEDGRKLVMGPVWDFDIAVGNRGASSVNGTLAARRNYWFAYLLQVEEFQVILAERWAEVNEEILPRVLESVEELAYLYNDEFLRNFEQHEVLGTEIWQNPQVIIDIETFDGQVEYLIDWVIRRANWFTTFIEAGNFTMNLSEGDFNPDIYATDSADN